MAETQIPTDGVPAFFMDAVHEIDRLSKFGRMVDLGFMLGATLSTIFDLFHKRLEGNTVAEEAIIGLRPLIEELEPYAAAESTKQLPYLRSLLVIRYVSIIETVVHDAVVYSLQHVPSVLARDEVKHLKGTVAELLTSTPAERVEFLANALTQSVEAPLQKGVGKFEALLAAVGLDAGIDGDVRKVLLELLSVRNVFVHAGGRVDARLVEDCPWLDQLPGQRVRVTPAMGERYRTAAVYYLVDMILRWVKRDSISTNIAAFVGIRESALQKLRTTTAPLTPAST